VLTSRSSDNSLPQRLITKLQSQVPLQIVPKTDPTNFANVYSAYQEPLPIPVNFINVMIQCSHMLTGSVQ
jgi:hypothetical protein